MSKNGLKQLQSDIIIQKPLRGNTMTFHSTWGLFSPREIDEGTELLINQVKVKPDDTILDLGCGYGAIGLTLAKLVPQGRFHLVDKDFVAVEYTKKNAELNTITNAEIYLSNAFSHVPDIKFDTIVSNIPAKVGKELFWIMLHGAKAHLKPNGKLYVVTISGLKEFIKRNFIEIFGNHEKLAQSKTYTVSVVIKR